MKIFDDETEERLRRLETTLARCVDALYYLVSDSREAPKVVAKLCVMRDEIRRENARRVENASQS